MSIVNERHRYNLARDNDGHWYILLANHDEDWSHWLNEGDEDELPWFAERLSGHPSSINFEKPSSDVEDWDY